MADNNNTDKKYVHPCEAVLSSGLTRTAWKQTHTETRYGRVARPADGVWPTLYYNMLGRRRAEVYTQMFGGGESVVEYPTALDGIDQTPGDPLPEVADMLGLDISQESRNGEYSPYILVRTVMMFCPDFAAYVRALNERVTEEKLKSTDNEPKGDTPLSNAALIATLNSIQAQLDALRATVTGAPATTAPTPPSPSPSPVDPSTLAPGVGLPSGVGSGSHPFTPLDGLGTAPSTPPDGATPLEVAEYKFAKVFNALMGLRDKRRSDGKALMLVNPDGSTVELSASPEFKECREALAQTGSGFNSGD